MVTLLGLARNKLAEGEDSSTNSLEVSPTSRQYAFEFAGESSLPQNFALHDHAQLRNTRRTVIRSSTLDPGHAQQAGA
jgi:hypothetical protein